MNNLLLRALSCTNDQRPPVWFMRQAGRFLPEYRALRQKHSLWELFHTPELAAEATLQPLKTLGVDAAILFSDILVIAEIFGYELRFENKPELYPPKTEVRKDVRETLSYVNKTIELLKDISVPLIGFCGGPYTVAKYMKAPFLLQQITDASIEYLQMQIDAGIQAVQIFDSWGMENPEVSLPYLKQIVDAIDVPVIVFSRGSCRFVKEFVDLKPDCISFDWEREMHELRKEVPSHIAVQGNIDPEILKGPHFEGHVVRLLESMQGEKGFIINLGHGVLPETPVAHAVRVVELVKQTSAALRR